MKPRIFSQDFKIENTKNCSLKKKNIYEFDKPIYINLKAHIFL